MWQVMTCRDRSWHVVTFVTFHDMLWHLHEPAGHDMRVMSRRLIPTQGSEPETHWCPETDFGSSRMHFLDPVWYISWIQSDVSCLGSDPTYITLFTCLFNYLNTRTHSREGGLWMIIRCFKGADVASLGGIHFGGIHPTNLLWSRKLRFWGKYPPSYHQQIFQNIHRVIISKYSKTSQLSCLSMLSLTRRQMRELLVDDCIVFRLSSYCGAGDHPPYILDSNVHWLDHHCCCCCCKAHSLKRTVLICNCRSFFGLNLV
jgi:hypothetical protein